MFVDFLAELKEKEIEVYLSGGKINYSGPEHFIDESFIERLKKYKGKLIKHLWPRECTNMMPINTEGTKTPFILLHGEKMNYPLSEHLGSDYPFYGFFHYGSQGERIFHKKIESFAKDYITQLQKIVPDGPYYLSGFSFGGLVAFEMALQLQKAGFEVPVLILIDCKVPSLNEPVASTKALSGVFQQLYGFTKRVFWRFYHKGRGLWYEFILKFRSTLRTQNRNYYIMSTYMDIAKRYQPGAVLKGDILLFKSEKNLSVYKYLGWDSYCEKVKLVMLKGDHKEIYETLESYKTLSKNIEEWLQKHKKI